MKTYLNKNGEKILFSLYIALYLVFALTMMLTQPFVDFSTGRFLNPPDEGGRYQIAMFVCKYGRIPVGSEPEVWLGGYGFSYAYYNIFPYILQGWLMRFVSLFTTDSTALVLTARGLNVFFGLIMAVLVYLTGRRVFKNKYLKWMFAFMVTFLPEALFVHTYVNTDSCAMLSTIIMVYAMVAIYQDGVNYKNSALLALGVAVCALSYYNAYGVILCSAILFIGYFVRKDSKKITFDYKNFFKFGFFALGLVALMAGWWFIRSYIVLDGDILGLATRKKMQEQYASTFLRPSNSLKARGYSLMTVLIENRLFQNAYKSFIAAYGSLSIWAPRYIYWIYMAVHGVGGIGWIIGMGKLLKNIKENSVKIFWNIVMVIMSVIPFVLLIIYAYATEYADQGRYVLPGLLSFMLMMTAGYEALSEVKAFSKIYAWKNGLLPKLAVILIIIFVIAVQFDMVFRLSLGSFISEGMILGGID